MKATITYKLGRILHPWDARQYNKDVYVWCLIKVTTPEHGRRDEEPVAIFNLDSEARLFQGHVYAGKLDGKLVDIDKDVKELFRQGINY